LISALLRRFLELPTAEQLEFVSIAGEYVTSTPAFDDVMAVAASRREALEVMGEVADEVGLTAGRAPTAEQFNRSSAAALRGWGARRVARAWGQWAFATAAYRGERPAASAAQRAIQRTARQGVHRARDDYLEGIRRWLRTTPRSRTARDYDEWRKEYNRSRPAGELPVVSYSMLRKALPWPWDETLRVAARELDPADAHPRRASRARKPLHGPDGLISLKEVRAITGLGKTAARNLTYARGFPHPAYVQPAGPRTRLWRRREVAAYLAGEPIPPLGSLQEKYVNRDQVAMRLGVGKVTVTTRSSPRVPEPEVRVGGLQLWLNSRIEEMEAKE
jgi:hypothetical protein